MKLLKAIVVLVILAVIGLTLWLPNMDDYQTTGEMTLPALQQPVTVHRDDFGIPYIYAESLDDAITAQGFIVAQHRLFQMELYRQIALGRLSEMIGERGLGRTTRT